MNSTGTGIALSFICLVFLLWGFKMGREHIEDDLRLHGCEYVLVEMEHGDD